MTKSLSPVYEDDEIIIIDKPSGLASQGGAAIKESVDKILCEQLKHPVFLVHRLDRATSGLLIVAKSPASADKWTKLIATKKVQKTYEALSIVQDPNIPKSGTITKPIVQHGRTLPARTDYKILSQDIVETERGEMTLAKVSLTLSTGRMHQIRIHLSSVGLPIVLDDKHGCFPANRALKKALGLKTLQLTCVKLEFGGVSIHLPRQTYVRPLLSKVSTHTT